MWKAEDYQNYPERWVHRLTDEEIEELGSAADKFIAENIPLTEISKVSFNVLDVLSKKNWDL